MFKDVRQEIKQAEASLRALGDKASADMASDALNHCAYFARQQVRLHIKGVFDRPTSRTKDAVFVNLADANKPVAEVKIKDMGYGKSNVSPAMWLAAEATGGARKQKRFEKKLESMSAFFGPGHNYLMPGKNRKTDSFGNITGSDIVKLLVDLKATGNAGFQMDRNGTGRKSSRGSYFFFRKDKEGKPTGDVIFERKGDTTTPAFFATAKATYRPRFRFYDVVAEAWREKIKEAWAKAWAKHIGRAVRV